MRPAFSLIFFTSLSGLGLGFATVVGLGLLPAPSAFWWMVHHGLAIGLIGAGVASSTFHLGHPERAWRALSQWKSSWLSREGVLAAVTLVVLVVWAADGLYHQASRPWLGWLTAGLSLATIWATAMIYASLKTVARWHHPLTPFVFVSYALTGGMIVAAMLDTMANGLVSVLALYSILMVIISTGIAHLWSRIAGMEGSGSTPESATGLGNLGEVRMLMPPHTEENWLQHEMGYKVARKHASVLRLMGYALSALLPMIVLWLAPASAMLMVAAALAHTAGVMMSRWLFFAEAKHTVTLYYGERH